MVWLEGASQVLGGKEAEVVFDRENPSLHVQMVKGDGSVATSAQAKATVLNQLEATDGGRREIG